MVNMGIVLSTFLYHLPMAFPRPVCFSQTYAACFLSLPLKFKSPGSFPVPVRDRCHAFFLGHDVMADFTCPDDPAIPSLSGGSMTGTS